MNNFEYYLIDKLMHGIIRAFSLLETLDYIHAFIASKVFRVGKLNGV